jgi:hypothetical protein
MGKVKVRYYTIRHRSGHIVGFWQPTKAMREAGFELVRCGEDGPAAWRKAEEWNARWDSYRNGGAVRKYPVGSVSAAFYDYRQTGIWTAKRPRTREDWDRGWKYIEHAFGQVAPETIMLAQIDAWYRSIVAGKGIREGHRAVKIWRALWVAMVALGYCHKDDPSLLIRREAPKPRRAIWREGEVVRLVKDAWRRDYHGLACIISVAWDAGLSPVDVRKLIFAQMTDDGQEISFSIDRAKTGQEAIGTLQRRATALVRAYVATLPGEHLPTAQIFRHRKGRAYSKDTLGHDFAKIRGERETRTLADMRRSVGVEALAGGANASQISSKLANTLSTNAALHRTYLPVDRGAVEAVDRARIEGRRKNKNRPRSLTTPA